MAIVRTYVCPDCSDRLGTIFKFDKLHFDRNEPPPECPGCQAASVKNVPAAPAYVGNASKAGDLAGRILEEDYGISPSQINDRQREGDLAVKIAAPLQKQADNFFNGAGPSMPAGQMIKAAKASAAVSRAEGSNPLTMLQRAKKSTGQSPAKVLCIPVARA